MPTDNELRESIIIILADVIGDCYSAYEILHQPYSKAQSDAIGRGLDRILSLMKKEANHEQRDG